MLERKEKDMEHNLILCLHEHINHFNRSMTLATDLDRDKLYVYCATNNEGFLEPVSYGTGITRPAYIEKKPKHKHEYKGGCKVRKDFYIDQIISCLLYTSPSPRDLSTSRMPSSA